ncbi:MAG: hypothetical protein Q8880_09090 [Bacteroidota bacterium]|nr:hypothetical protein [Bacteroidota bacterium]
MKKSLLILFIAFFCGINAYSQRGFGHGNGNREKLESDKIAFITNQLQLTPSEAQIFWPVYNEYNLKLRELKKKCKENSPIGKGSATEMTDKEALELADNFIVNEQKMLDLKKEYHSKFKAVLSPKKLLKFYRTEKDFKRELLKKIRDNKMNR